jgi:SAM-dependent methyltransferase
VTGARRRQSFDEAAEDYNRWRAGYPQAVIEDIVASGHIETYSRVLEVGCGTGQLSVPLAERGVELVAVELGRNLAAFARRNLARFPHAQVENASFEDWYLPAEPFDTVVVANTFHWLDLELRFSKSARALKPGGYLTIGHAQHIRGGTPDFFEETQRFYLKWGLSDDPNFQPPAGRDAPIGYPELDDRQEFGPVRRDRFEIPQHHTAESYVGWLRTDSLIATLDPRDREGFLVDIGDLIDNKFHGRVSRNFLYEVITAAKII